MPPQPEHLETSATSEGSQPTPSEDTPAALRRRPTPVRDTLMGGLLLGGGLWLLAGWIIDLATGVDATVFLLDLRLIPDWLRTPLIGVFAISAVCLGWVRNACRRPCAGPFR